MSCCTPVWITPIQYSMARSDQWRKVHDNTGHCSTSTFSIVAQLESVPRKRNHGDRPTDDRADTMRTICGMYEAIMPTETTDDSIHAIPSCGGSSHMSVLMMRSRHARGQVECRSDPTSQAHHGSRPPCPLKVEVIRRLSTHVHFLHAGTFLDSQGRT